MNMPGFVEGIDAALQSAGLFVMPSRYEGYPNVLLEALAASCPAVATNVPAALQRS